MDLGSRPDYLSDSGTISPELRILTSCFKAVASLPLSKIVPKAAELYPLRKGCNFDLIHINEPLPVVVTTEAELILVRNTMTEIAGAWEDAGNVHHIDEVADRLEKIAVEQGVLEYRTVRDTERMALRAGS